MVIEDLSFSSDAGRAVNKAKVDNQNPPTKKSDDKSGGGWSSASTAASKESSGQRKSLVVDITRSVSQDRPDSVASFNSFDDSDTEIHQAAAPISMMAQVDIEDLRNVYQNSITAPGASYAQKQLSIHTNTYLTIIIIIIDCLLVIAVRTLARNIRFALAADELSDRVMQIGGTSTIPHVTWQMLLNIAGLAEEKPRSKSSEAAACLPRMETADENLNNGLLFDGDKSVPNRKSLKSDDDSEAYVDSLSHQRSTSSNMNAPLKIEANDPVDMAITLFKKIDRDSNGVVTHVELIKALRGDSKLASVCALI